MKLKIKKITTKSSFVNYVYALKDENPQIKILSPEQDLVVLPKSKIKIIYEASDDFGVKSVDLVCKKSKEISRLNICNRNNPFKNEILETEWDLSNLALQFSDAIEIYLEATDNDVITGPNKGVSNVIKIQVYDVNKEIEALTQDIDDEKLEDMIKNSERLYKRTQDFLSDLEKMSGKWDEEKTKKLRGDIERIAQLMENLQIYC